MTELGSIVKQLHCIYTFQNSIMLTALKALKHQRRALGHGPEEGGTSSMVPGELRRFVKEPRSPMEQLRTDNSQGSCECWRISYNQRCNLAIWLDGRTSVAWGDGTCRGAGVTITRTTHHFTKTLSNAKVTEYYCSYLQEPFMFSSFKCF